MDVRAGQGIGEFIGMGDAQHARARLEQATHTWSAVRLNRRLP
jgi:hypothetical protein